MAVRTSNTNGRAVRARGQRTVRRLLDAGIEVFGEKGFHPSRVDDIVQAAQTSHGTFYLYFANKEELFRALAEEVASAMATLAQSLGPLEPSATGRAALRSWIADVCALYDEYGPVIRAWTEAEIGGNEVGRLGTDVLTQFTRVVFRRVEEIAPPDLDAGIAALALVAMLERLNYYVISGQVDIKPDEMIDTLARVIHASLFGNSREVKR